MTFDEQTAAAHRADARALDAYADSDEPYPADMQVNRPNRTSRMFNLRLSHEQYDEIATLARQRHLPASTMARAWLLERLDQERPAS